MPRATPAIRPTSSQSISDVQFRWHRVASVSQSYRRPNRCAAILIVQFLHRQHRRRDKWTKIVTLLLQSIQFIIDKHPSKIDTKLYSLTSVGRIRAMEIRLRINFRWNFQSRWWHNGVDFNCFSVNTTVDPLLVESIAVHVQAPVQICPTHVCDEKEWTKKWKMGNPLHVTRPSNQYSRWK